MGLADRLALKASRDSIAVTVDGKLAACCQFGTISKV